MKLDRIKRRLIAEYLLWIINYKISHELWRVTHTHKEALTPKEIEYLERCRIDLENIWLRLQKMRDRLEHHR